MEESKRFDAFSLLGGPLHRLGCRFGLVREKTNGIALGLALGLTSWIILMALASMEGVVQQVLSVGVIGGHVRLLVVIPLFFWCEALLDPRMTAFVRMIVQSGVVPAAALPALELEVARIISWKNAWMPDVLCLVAAVLVSLTGSGLSPYGSTATYDPSGAGAGLSLTAQWYWFVCLTLFRFLMFRWFLRIGLWSYFLWRVVRLELNLVPTHPDGAAGLGYIEVVHGEFSLLILAISAVQSAAFAESIVAGTMTLSALYPALILVLSIEAAIFFGPLCLFVPKLWLCRVNGMEAYMQLASNYVNDFDKKWIGADGARGEELLGTPDLQSLADLASGVDVIRSMRSVPASPRLVITFVTFAMLPMLPLALLLLPVGELAERLLKMLFSL